MSLDFTNLTSNNGLSRLSSLVIDRITLESQADATDFNTGGLIINGGLSVKKQTRMLGNLTLGDELFIINDKNINWQDNIGGNSVMTIQTDNNFVHYGSRANGNLAAAWGIPMRNNNSAFYVVYPQINLNAAPATLTTAAMELYGGLLIRNTTSPTSLGASGSFNILGGGSISGNLFTNNRISMSGTTGFLQPPRMTTAQRNALNSSTPLQGMQIFNTTTGFMQYYNGAVWVDM